MQGLLLLQLCFYAVIILVMVIFIANYPAGLPAVRFYAVEMSLAALLVLNIFGVNPRPASASPQLRAVLDWSFLALSALLVFGFVWLSGQVDLVYLLSIVCFQADSKRGVRPAGLIFGAANLLAWLGLQIIMGASLNEIIARQMALTLGVIFGWIVVALLQRSARQTKRAEDLLQELQAANRELAAAQQKEKDLAVAEERVRLSRELHDSVTQSLYSVTLYAEAAAELIDAGDVETAAGHLRELRDTAQDALREMRLLIFELRRPALEKSGLAAALQARLDAVESRGGINARLLVEGREHLPAPVQAELYRIAQEALNNVIKHAKARNVQVRLWFDETSTGLEVCDDGVGFEPETHRSGSGLGLAGIRERAQKIGGELQIESVPGQGTKINVRVPTLSPSSYQNQTQPISPRKETD